MPVLFILIFVGVVILIIVMGVINSIKEKERTEAIAAQGQAMGLRMLQDDPHFEKRHPNLRCFHRGDGGHAAYNLLGGRREVLGRSVQVITGDFKYYSESTDSDGDTSRSWHSFSFMLLQLPWRRVPTLALRREGLFDRVKGWFGFDDIDFESEAFSRRYHIQSNDKRFAYGVFEPQVIDYFMRTHASQVDEAEVCLADGWLCIAGGARWETHEFEKHVRWMEQFVDLWPAWLIDEMDQKEAA